MTTSPPRPLVTGKPWAPLGRTLLGLGLCLAIWGSIQHTGLSFTALLGPEGRRQMGLFVTQMFPPDLSPALFQTIAWGTLETLAISFLGTCLAVLLAALLLGGATRTLVSSSAFGDPSPDPWPVRFGHAVWYGIARTLLNLFRSIPELIWALLCILVVGLGPFAGVLALGVHTAGVLGRLCAEVLENIDRRPCEALQATGASRFHIVLYGMLPQALPDLLSFALYRWEVNIRAAAILGFIGAGGLGYHLFIALSLFHHHQLLTLIMAIFVVVTLVDLASAWMRRLLV